MTKIIVMVINPGLQLVPSFLPVAGVDTPYSVELRALFGEPAYRFSIVDGKPALDALGVTLTNNGDGTATLAGSPNAGGTFEFTVRLQDGTRKPIERVYRLQVVALPLSISGTLADMTVGTPYSDSLTITGGVGPYTLGSYTLPAGLTAAIVGSSINVTGTPTGAGLGAGYSKSFGVTIPFTDSAASAVSYSQTVGITIPTLVVTGNAPDGFVGTGASYAYGSTGGAVGTKTFTSIPSPPITGKTLSTAGVLSGTPTVAATYNFDVYVTDTEGNVSAAHPESVIIASVGKRPDTVTGVTLWVDGTDASNMYTDALGSIPPTTDGQSIVRWRNKINGTLLTGNGTYETAVVSGKSVAEFATAGTQYFVTAAASTFITNTDALFIMAVYTSGLVGAQPNIYNNNAIIRDASNYIGAYIRSSPSDALVGYNFDTNADYAISTAAQGTWRVFTFRHKSGNLQSRINGGSWVTTASGNTGNLASAFFIGKVSSTAPTGGTVQLAHMVIGTGVSDADVLDMEKWVGNEIGITI